jgi:RimJ/RimL family protein N-acetyltransferase
VAELVLRAATADDCERVFTWANDPITRAVSFSSAAIAWADHVAWFEQQLARSDRNVLIASADRDPVAVVRLDRLDAATCVISINVAPTARGRGLGTAALLAATAYAAKLGFTRIRALIRPDNAASVRAFTAAGYAQVDTTTVADQDALVFERSC